MADPTRQARTGVVPARRVQILGALLPGRQLRGLRGDRCADLRADRALVAVLFFHATEDQTVTYQKVNWTVVADSMVARTIADAMRPWAPGQSPEPRESLSPRDSGGR